MSSYIETDKKKAEKGQGIWSKRAQYATAEIERLTSNGYTTQVDLEKEPMMVLDGSGKPFEMVFYVLLKCLQFRRQNSKLQLTLGVQT